MPEYAFDITVRAVVRVKAISEAEARDKLEVIDCVDLSDFTFDASVVMTEASVALDKPALLFEIDGEPPEFPSDAHYVAAARDAGWLPGDEDTAKQFCEAEGIDASTADPKDARL